MSESNNDDLIVIIYYNGRRYFGASGQVFEGDTKMFRMSPRCKYNDLKKTIYKKLRLQRGQSLSRLIARCASGNPVQWVAVEVVEDEDVQLVVDAFHQHGQSSFIELYAELNTGGQSSSQHSIPCSYSIDINTDPVDNLDDTYVDPPLPSPPPIPSDVYDAHEMYDPAWRTDSEEEDVDEGLVPDSGSSDTDVDGDFERVLSSALCPPMPSPGNVGMHNPPPGFLTHPLEN